MSNLLVSQLVAPLISQVVGVGIDMALGGLAIGGVLAVAYVVRFGASECLLMLRGQSDMQLASKALEQRNFEAKREKLVRKAYRDSFPRRRY